MYSGAIARRIPCALERPSVDDVRSVRLRRVTMSTPRASIRPTFRIAGACGVASAALVLAAPFMGGAGIAATVWLFGWVLLLPFIAGVSVLVRDAGGRAAWLSPAVTAAG